MKCLICGKDFKNKKDLSTHSRYCKKYFKYKDDVIEMYNDGLSIRKISKTLNLSKSRIIDFLGDNIRSISDASKLARKLYPEKYKHSDATKNKIREIRLKWMKNNPEKTAWRLSNISYPEKLILNKFKELKYDEKYLIIRERSFYPYYIDFAFENEKVAVEIDGSQHLLPDRKESDNKKDELLITNGWRVIRISEYEVKNNIDNIISILEKNLKKNENDDNKKIQIGILKEPKKYVKKTRLYNGFTDKEIEGHLKQRKIERPPYPQLISEIKELGYRGTGKNYGVSDNTIRKWKKIYEKIDK